MQIEITESVKTKKTIDIEFPYYYSHDCSGDSYSSVWYGKIDGNRVFKVNHTESYRDNDIGYEFEIEDFSSSFHCYFKEEYRSTEEEFLAAKNKMMAELSAVDQEKSGYSVSKLIDRLEWFESNYDWIVKQRLNPMQINCSRVTMIKNADEVFERLWSEQTTYAEKNKAAAYTGFLMALDYVGNLK